MRQLPDLPVLETLPALRAALSQAGRAVLAAPPGSGKTTLAPLALLDEPWLRGKKKSSCSNRAAWRRVPPRRAWRIS